MEYDYDKGLNYAFYLLSLQMRTVQEIEKKLASKEMSPDLIQSIMTVLKDANYLNDVTYAEYYIRSRRHKYGDYRIKMELSRKGVSAVDVLEAYDHLDANEDEPHSNEDTIRIILDKKIATANIDWDRLKTDYKYKYGTYQKLASFLANRGFSSSVIKSAVSERLAQEFIDEQ